VALLWATPVGRQTPNTRPPLISARTTWRLVNGVKELDIAGVFGNGRLAFYNFSQANVTYSAFEVVEGPFPAVPEPETYAMMLAGLGLLGFIARRR